MGDEKLRVRFAREFRVGRATRLSFRCYATECARLTVALRTELSGRPHQLVRELPGQQWVQFDLSVRDDFHNPLGTAGRLRPGTRVLEVEWRGVRLGPKAGFHVADVAVYEATRAGRVAVARRRADVLEQECHERGVVFGPSASLRARADAFAARLAACRTRLDPQAERQAAEGIESIERELDALADQWRRLRLQATMARVFAQGEPRFAVGVEGPARRVSARNPALPFRGQVARVHELWAAGGEAESFQVVAMGLWEPLRAVEVTWSDFSPQGATGAVLPRAAISASVPSELYVYPRPELPPDRAGWMPDPLLPYTPFDVGPGGLRSVLLTVRVPADLPPGDYEGTVSVRPLGLEPVELAVRLHRWGFALVGRRFPVIGPIDAAALREISPDGAEPSRAARRALYDLLLRHRVDPIPLLGQDEEADVEDVRFCLERGLGLAVLHRAPSGVTARDPAVARAARCATRLWEAGWGKRGALLLPLAPRGGALSRFVAAVNEIGREHPVLHLVAGGEGDPAPGLAAAYWRRPLNVETPGLPSADAVEVRRSRVARLEAWELPAGAPDYPQPNLTLASRLAEARFLPWLAWRHGVRALVLGSVNRWRDNNPGDGLLVYPGHGDGFAGSLRLVALRDGIEDHEYLWLLHERRRRLRERLPEDLVAWPVELRRTMAAVDQALAEVELRTGSFESPTRDPHTLAALRQRLGTVAERLEAAWWAEVDGATDLPAPPARLAATPADGLVTLTWSRSPDQGVTAYNVFRSRRRDGGFVRLNALPVSALIYADRAVDTDVTYPYFVRSFGEKEGDGPRSPLAEATPRPAPKVVWLEIANPTRDPAGPVRVVLRLEGPRTGGLLPLVRPQIDYCVADGAYDGYDEMTRRVDKTWVFDIRGVDWRRHPGQWLRVKVRLVDRQNRLVTPDVERKELIDAVAAPR
jgi:hypothetical protein